MPSWDDVNSIALALPETTERPSHGQDLHSAAPLSGPRPGVAGEGLRGVDVVSGIGGIGVDRSSGGVQHPATRTSPRYVRTARAPERACSTGTGPPTAAGARRAPGTGGPA